MVTVGVSWFINSIKRFVIFVLELLDLAKLVIPIAAKTLFANDHPLRTLLQISAQLFTFCSTQLPVLHSHLTCTCTMYHYCIVRVYQYYAPLLYITDIYQYYVPLLYSTGLLVLCTNYCILLVYQYNVPLLYITNMHQYYVPLLYI